MRFLWTWIWGTIGGWGISLGAFWLMNSTPPGGTAADIWGAWFLAIPFLTAYQAHRVTSGEAARHK